MNEDLGRRAHAVLMQAVELDAQARADFVRTACADHPTLARRVHDLLAAIDRSSDFLETPALGARTPTPPAPLPRTIGDYHIERVIGVGGMATVYEAIQDQPRRRVALKVMRHGLTHTSALHRFRYESEVLARLHHPGIAQIFEAGAYDAGHGVSTPFFAMEFIDAATPITSYCQHKNLSITDRLEMFAWVCDAVQHGHQLGVIHRDLKPGNILVDSQGQPKVIDFGVARSSDPEQRITQQSDFGQLIGTLHYMSPEQCCDDESISIRTDVYSLGVLVYELLCGRLPHDFAQTPIPEALRIIREDLPGAPGAHDPALRGDIDAIVMMAMDKDPNRRYPTAAALAADVRRFLHHETIEARPPTMIYRCRLFVRRHRVLVTAAVCVLLAVLGGSVLSARFAYQAMQESDRRLRAEGRALAERDTARWQAYIANIAGAFAALQTSEFQRMRTRLAATYPQHRGWEWYFLAGLADRSRRTTVVHEDMVDAFDMSASGGHFATAAYDGTLRVWDASDGSNLTRITATPGAAINSVAWSPDEARIVTGSDDRSVRIWDAQSGDQLCMMGFHDHAVTSVSWAPGEVVASADLGGNAHIWDVEHCQIQGSLIDQPGGIEGVAYSPDGSYLLTWSTEGQVWLRDGLHAERCHAWTFGDLIQSAAISDDASRVAIGGAGGKVTVWNVSDGGLVQEFTVPKNDSTVQSLAFSHAGNHLAIGFVNRNIVLWSIPEADVVGELRGHAEAVTGLWFATDDRMLTSCSRDRTVRVWGIDRSTETGRITTLSGHSDDALAVAFSPDSAILASGGRDTTIRLWDPDLGLSLGILRGHTGFVQGLAFSPDGALLASASIDQSVRIWDAKTGQPVRTLAHSGVVWSAIFSPDGRRLATAGGEGIIRLWELPNFELAGVFRGHTARINHAAFSHDGRLLASASRDQTVRVWDLEKGTLQHVLTGHRSDVFAVAFSADDRYVYSGSRDQTVRVWDPDSGTQVTVLGAEGQLIATLAVSPDGCRLAAGSWFGEIVLWDTASLELVASFKGHDMAVRSLAFGAGGRWLASASHDTTVRLFESAPPADRIILRQKTQELRDAAKAVLDRFLAVPLSGQEILSAVEKDASIDHDLRSWVRKLILIQSLQRTAADKPGP